jgi:hypothetical protein
LYCSAREMTYATLLCELYTRSISHDNAT